MNSQQVASFRIFELQHNLCYFEEHLKQHHKHNTNDEVNVLLNEAHSTLSLLRINYLINQNRSQNQAESQHTSFYRLTISQLEEYSLLSNHYFAFISLLKFIKCIIIHMTRNRYSFQRLSLTPLSSSSSTQTNIHIWEIPPIFKYNSRHSFLSKSTHLPTSSPSSSSERGNIELRGITSSSSTSVIMKLQKLKTTQTTMILHSHLQSMIISSPSDKLLLNLLPLTTNPTPSAYPLYYIKDILSYIHYLLGLYLSQSFLLFFSISNFLLL